MIDARHLSMGPREIWIPGFAANNTSNWIPFTIPQEANFIDFTLIAGGGGGGRPNVAAATSGGGGGGCSGITRGTFPTSSLPKMIYLSIGVGGLGATANNTAGAGGVASFICALPTTNDEDCFLLANGGGQGGVNGGGAGALIAAIANMDLAHLGTWQAIAGQTGGNGSVTTGGGVGVQTNIFISAGAGGGGSSGGAGGAQTSATTRYPTLSGGATGDNPGASGIALYRPLTFIGGTGGGGINGAGTGLNRGGDGGGYGSGGGGGGNAASGVSGNGGNGAPGLLIMRWW